MGLLDVLRNGVALANKITAPLQGIVSYQRAGVPDGSGGIIPGAVVQLRAIIDWKQRQVRTISGILTTCRASVTFLDISALNAATDGQGIGDMDTIVLPDGTTGPILDMSGFIDAETGHPLATEVFLG